MCSSGARGQSASWFGICTLRGTCECWLGRTGPAVCAVASPFWAQALGRHRGSVLSGASEACRLGNGRDASQGKEDLPCAKAGWTQGPRLCDRTVTSFIVSLPFLPSFFWFSSEAACSCPSPRYTCGLSWLQCVLGRNVFQKRESSGGRSRSRGQREALGTTASPGATPRGPASR